MAEPGAMASNFPPQASQADKLRVAASKGQVEKVRELVQAGASFEADRDGRTALHYAALNGYSEVAKILIGAGCNIDAQDSLGYTPLLRAAAQGHIEVTSCLLDEGCAVDRQDDVHGNTALHEAAWNGFSQTIELLSKSNANVFATNKAGFTALHLASQNGHNQTSRVLLYAGCSPDAKNNYGDTALHTAARYGHAGVTRILISAKANIDEQNKNGDTALHISAALRRRKLAKLLVENGINVDIKNKQNETASDVARRKEHPEIIIIITSQPKKPKHKHHHRHHHHGNKIRFDDPRAATPGPEVALDEPVEKEKEKGLFPFFKKKKTKEKPPQQAQQVRFKDEVMREQRRQKLKQMRASGAMSPTNGLFGQYVPKKGSIYYRDLAGNIKQGPAGYAPACAGQCVPMIKKLEQKVDADRQNLYDHIDATRHTLDDRIDNMERRTGLQVHSIDKLTRERLEIERQECQQRIDRNAMKERLETGQMIENAQLELKSWFRSKTPGPEHNQNHSCDEDYGFGDFRRNERNRSFHHSKFNDAPPPGPLVKSRSDETLSCSEYSRHRKKMDKYRKTIFEQLKALKSTKNTAERARRFENSRSMGNLPSTHQNPEGVGNRLNRFHESSPMLRVEIRGESSRTARQPPPPPPKNFTSQQGQPSQGHDHLNQPRHLQSENSQQRQNGEHLSRAMNRRGPIDNSMLKEFNGTGITGYGQQTNRPIPRNFQSKTVGNLAALDASDESHHNFSDSILSKSEPNIDQRARPYSVQGQPFQNGQNMSAGREYQRKQSPSPQYRVSDRKVSPNTSSQERSLSPRHQLRVSDRPSNPQNQRTYLQSRTDLANQMPQDRPALSHERPSMPHDRPDGSHDRAQDSNRPAMTASRPQDSHQHGRYPYQERRDYPGPSNPQSHSAQDQNRPETRQQSPDRQYNQSQSQHQQGSGNPPKYPPYPPPNRPAPARLQGGYQQQQSSYQQQQGQFQQQQSSYQQQQSRYQQQQNSYQQQVGHQQQQRPQQNYASNQSYQRTPHEQPQQNANYPPRDLQSNSQTQRPTYPPRERQVDPSYQHKGQNSLPDYPPRDSRQTGPDYPPRGRQPGPEQRPPFQARERMPSPPGQDRVPLERNNNSAPYRALSPERNLSSTRNLDNRPMEKQHFESQNQNRDFRQSSHYGLTDRLKQGAPPVDRQTPVYHANTDRQTPLYVSDQQTPQYAYGSSLSPNTVFNKTDTGSNPDSGYSSRIYNSRNPLHHTRPGLSPLAHTPNRPESYSPHSNLGTMTPSSSSFTDRSPQSSPMTQTSGASELSHDDTPPQGSRHYFNPTSQILDRWYTQKTREMTGQTGLTQLNEEDNRIKELEQQLAELNMGSDV